MASPSIPTYHDLSVSFNTSSSSGVANVHYVEAGDRHLPTLLLLHGFPSSSTQYREFIPLLSQSYHVFAPDMPGFGLTTVPADFTYAFENLAAVIAAWIAALHLVRFALYIFDYGAPVGLRIAAQQPELVAALITQNGNAYIDGFGQEFWAPVFALWNTSDSAAARRTVQDEVLTFAATQAQYGTGTPAANLDLVDPALTYHSDYQSNLAGAAKQDYQTDLFYDYRTNVELYPKFQEYIRESKVPVLAVWGKNDPAFIPPGAEAFKRDSPDAVVRFVDAGHFALETQRWEIARIVKAWLTSIGY